MNANSRTRAPGAIAVAALVAVVLAACSSLLDLQDPDIINPGDVTNPDGAVAAYNGAIGDFTFANDGNNGGTEGQVLVSGVMADEFYDSETFPTRIEYDSRAINESNGTLNGVFFNLQKARVALEGAGAALQTFAPTPASRIGEMLGLAGFTYVYFAENYCSAVPFSERQPDGSIAYGTPLSTDEILDRALAKFDSAIAASITSAADTAARYLAAVGKGRTLVDKADFAGAAAAVAAVPTKFAYLVGHSIATGNQQNGIFVFNNQAPAGTGRFSVADTEGTNGLPFRTAADPRVVSVLRGKGFDNVSPLYVLLKYASATSPTRVADGIEARLIEAEAAQQASNPSWLATLNTLRTDGTYSFAATDILKVDTLWHAGTGGVAGLKPLVDPGTAAARVNLLFRERAFWLFATGHRLGDLRRLARQYARAPNTIYPTGAYLHASTVFGSNTELPVPFNERNNPNYTGCDYNTP
jgi:hypothetical protein